MLGFVFEENSSSKNHYRDGFVFKKLRFQNVFRLHKNNKPAFSNSSGLNNVFEKLRFRDGLVWTVGLTVEIKLRFRDGLVWTVGLTVEIKLRFQIPLAQCGRCLSKKMFLGVATLSLRRNFLAFAMRKWCCERFPS